MRILASLVGSLVLALSLALPVPLAAQQEAHFSQAELDQMLAPIALYPDTLLSHILIASTYPLEVVQAARWSRDHPGLEGETAVAAVEGQDWDPSVKALVAFPQVLARMNDDLEWTQRLGDAFLLQESQVADSIQDLRARAYDAGNLDSLEHAHVHREPGSIIIEPASSHVVYVPYYDTRVIYGGWWWPAYPPIYWAYPHGYPAFYYGTTWFSWGPAIRISPFFFFSSFHWPYRHVVVVHHHRHPRHHRFHSGRDVARHDGARKWRHDPKHRRGVAYHDGRRHHDRDRSRDDTRSSRQARDTRRDGPSQSTADRREQQRRVFTANRPERRTDARDARPMRDMRRDGARERNWTEPTTRTEAHQRNGQRIPGTRLLPAQTRPTARADRSGIGIQAGSRRLIGSRPNGTGTRQTDVRRERSVRPAVRPAGAPDANTRRVDAGRSAARSAPGNRSAGEPRRSGPRSLGVDRSAVRGFTRNIPASVGRDSRSEGRTRHAPATRSSSEGRRKQGSGDQGRFSRR